MSTIRVGVTGADGFIGRHVVQRLRQDARFEVMPATRSVWASPDSLRQFVERCDCIIHLAGMNRGDDQLIHQTNVELVERLVEAIRQAGTRPHVMLASSTHRDQDSAYGRSKREGEQLLHTAAAQADWTATTLVIPGVFGPGGRPFYNSVVATFCHQLAVGQPCTIIEDRQIELISVHRLVDRMADLAAEAPTESISVKIEPMAQITTSQLLNKLQQFRDQFAHDVVPDLSDPFDAHLYATLLSALDVSQHTHQPLVRADERGRLFEIIKLANGGQVFFSTTKPGVIRGDHYHTRKIEWFCVLQGEATIRLRPVHGSQVHEFAVNGEHPRFISIPALHTHHIENTGATELLTMFWCNEIFDPADPDTIYEKVA